MKNVVNERGSRGQLTNQEHNDDSYQRDGDADLIGSGTFLPVALRDCLPLCHYLAEFLTLTYRMDQERIKDDKQRQR